MFAHLFSKISVFKILSLSFSLIILVFLFFLLLNKEFNQKSLAAGPVLKVNPISLNFGEVYHQGIIENRLRLLICNFGDGAVLNVNSITFNGSASAFSLDSSTPGLPAILAKTEDNVNPNICDSLDGPNKIEAVIAFNPTGAGFTLSDAKLTINTTEAPFTFDIPLKGKGIDTNTQRAKTWLEANYGDVYAIGDLYAKYTNTTTKGNYRIISGSDITNWTPISGATYKQPNSFISSFPDSNNNFTVSVGSVDVEGLITDLGGFNIYGYAVNDVSASSGYLGSDLTDPTDPLKPLGLNYKVCSGDLVIGDNVFSNDNTNNGLGSELIAAKGNIYIIGDTYYSAAKPAKIEDLASLGFMALKRTAGELANLQTDCASVADDCGGNQDCYGAYVNQYGGNIYLVDVHNLITAGANSYIIGVDYNIFNLTDGNIEANKNYCAETGEHPGKKVFDLDGSGFIDSNKEIYLGWDDYFGNPADDQNPYYIDVIYDYCQETNDPFSIPPTAYNINDNIEADTITVAPIHIVGTYYAEGAFHSGKAKLPLIVEGLVMAQSFHLEREAIVDNPSGILSPSEVFVYDGRAILNPPPGFRELINERFNFSLVKP